MMTPELRELLGQLEAKENEIRGLKEENKIDEAHALLEEVRTINKKIEIEKSINPTQKKEVVKVENREINVLETPEYRSAFIKNITGKAEMMNEEEKRALSTGSTSAGAVVPTAVYNKIDEYLKLFSPIRGLASVIASGSNLVIAMESGVPTAALVSEGSAIAESDATLGKVQFNAYKLATLIRISNELIADSIVDIEAYVAKKIAQAFAITEGNLFIKGTGSANNQPLGLVSGATVNGIAPLVVNNEGTAGAGDIAYGDIVKMYTAILPAYQAKATFLVSQDMFAKLMNLVDGMGRPILMQNVSTDVPYAIFGRPVVVEPNLDSANATGNKPMVFGDIEEAYQIVDRANMVIKSDVSRYVEYDQTAVVATKRFDGQVMDNKAFVTLELI